MNKEACRLVLREAIAIARRAHSNIPPIPLGSENNWQSGWVDAASSIEDELMAMLDELGMRIGPPPELVIPLARDDHGRLKT